MIATDRRSPRESLAEALGGTLLGRDGILVGTNVVWASVAGVVRVGGKPIGMWSDGAVALAAEFAAVAL